MASRKKTGRRHPLASAALLIIGLVAAGGASVAVGSVANAEPATMPVPTAPAAGGAPNPGVPPDQRPTTQTGVRFRYGIEVTAFVRV